MSKTRDSRNSLRIALVQPRSFSSIGFAGGRTADDREERMNLETCERFVSDAGNQGADLVVFPELFPGPTSSSESLRFDQVIEEMGRQACYHKVAVAYGGANKQESRYYNTYNLVTSQGELFTYHKMIPATGETTAIPGKESVVVDLGKARIGLAICWEAWFPEVARTLALRGAEIILFPTGGLIYELHDVWAAILQARAAENVAYVAASVRLFGAEDGMAYVFGPEGPEGTLLQEGMIVTDLDLSRLREMRSVDQEFSFPFPYRTIPGLLRSLHSDVVSAYSEAAATRPIGEG